MKFENDARALLRCGQELARVCAGHGERARVIVKGREVDAILAGAVVHAADGPADLPVTGDWVAVRLAEPDLALIEHVLPRRSSITRRAAGRRTEEQVLAANVDLAFLVCGLDGDFKVRRLERFLAITIDGGVEPVVVLNKADICASVEAAFDEARQCASLAPVLLNVTRSLSRNLNQTERNLPCPVKLISRFPDARVYLWAALEFRGETRRQQFPLTLRAAFEIATGTRHRELQGPQFATCK